MSHRVPGIGDQFPQLGDGTFDRPHPVVHVEDLSFAQQLTTDRRGYRLLVVWTDVGEDGVPVLWGCTDVAHVPYAGERHLKRPRDRRGGEGEDIHPDPELLYGVLGVHPEALLLVYHEQSEVLPVDVVGEQPVGADDHVHVAAPHRFDDGLLLALGEEPGEHLDPDRVGGEALGRMSGGAAEPRAWWAPAPPPACRRGPL